MSDTSELRSIREALSEVIIPEQIDNWLGTPNAVFGERTPIQVIDEGDVALLWRMIEILRSGTSS